MNEPSNKKKRVFNTVDVHYVLCVTLIDEEAKNYLECFNP